MAPNDLQANIDRLLREQQDTRLSSAVVVFAERKESGTGRYQSMIPLTQPQRGQQYRFEVDLDECTSCKSCVTACHSLNGLDPAEMWRKVGTLEQTQPGWLPFSQTVTAACHHCLEPACALGCPVKAYDKDPMTGIVRHLDDQCIGCQYCQMMCPYDVPVYNPRLGIVRKCDMCSNRLAQGEAPACVQACPTDAITIGIVDQNAIRSRNFLPTAADPQLTMPTTLYKKRDMLPAGLSAANHFQRQEDAAHQPLVWMLLLSQAGVGMLFWEALASLFGRRFSPWLAPCGAALVVLALGLATLHLGRPQKAWRFVLGLKTSWMSREILAFNLFMAAVAFECWRDGFHATHWSLGKGLLLGTGLLGVSCSCMIYIETRRPSWSRMRCLGRFFGTLLLLGLFGVVLICLIEDAGWIPLMPRMLGVCLGLLLLKLLLEARELPRQWTFLGSWTWTRWMAAWVSASALIIALRGTHALLWVSVAVGAGLVGEYCERSLFFAGLCHAACQAFSGRSETP